MCFVADFRSTHGLSPTLKEMAEALEVSKVTIHEHVGELIAKKLMTKKPSTSRSVRLTARGMECVPERGVSEARRWEKVAGWLHTWAMLDARKTGRAIPSLEELYRRSKS